MSPDNLTAVIGGGLTLKIMALNLVVAITTFFVMRWIIRRKRKKRGWPPL